MQHRSHSEVGPALHGVLVAMLTPFDATGELDSAAIERIVAHVQPHVTGICPVGSTGEGPHLPLRLRLIVTKLVRSLLQSDRLVIPAVAANAQVDAIAEIGAYADAEADAVLVAPPSYYPLSADALERYFTDLASSAPIPIVLYNIPQMTKNVLPVDVVGRLARHRNVIGIKDSSRDFEYFLAVLSQTSEADFQVLTGTDTMLMPSLIMGSGGTVAASANIVPGLGRKIVEAVAARRYDEAMRAQMRLAQIVRACRRGTFPAGWKMAASLMGLCGPGLAPPTQRLTDGEQAALTNDLRDLRVVGAVNA
jgi:dihydrodipicolinate synthase/N-acetylneuraminate lyase